MSRENSVKMGEGGVSVIGTYISPPVGRDACENITFPQLRFGKNEFDCEILMVQYDASLNSSMFNALRSFNMDRFYMTRNYC